MFYVIWLILTFVLSALGIVRFKPYYHNDDMAYPLLTDITTITIFLPCYFILLWLLIHIVYAHVNSLKKVERIFKQIKMWHRFHAVTFMEFCARWGGMEINMNMKGKELCSMSSG